MKSGVLRCLSPIIAFALPGGGHAWQRIWIVPAASAGAVLVLFALFFRSVEAGSERAPGRAVVSET